MHIDYINNTNIKPVFPTAMTLKEIFVVFLKRFDFTTDEAVAEFELINGKTKDEYMKTCRVGMKALGNRVGRAEVYMLYENAQNHSTFLFVNKE